MKTIAKARIVLLPIPTVGHIMSTVGMAKLLLCHHRGSSESHFFVTIFLSGPASVLAVDAYIASVTTSGLDINFLQLPPVEPPVGCNGPMEFVSLLMQKYKTLVKAAISDLQCFSTILLRS
ncbi:UDP-glycosyltransferase 71K1-like [Canna indica]|uniref:UDP-glycosyltransferase 71K1-like n=1 Tax=Canna indica TaxID=4628 RepID=A0AAQ3KFC7_9LILI|nr:UDP-glycosyltransferase 71K1-like [Canna indica]